MRPGTRSMVGLCNQALQATAKSRPERLVVRHLIPRWGMPVRNHHGGADREADVTPSGLGVTPAGGY